MGIISKRDEFCASTALPIVSNADSVLLGNVMDLGDTAGHPGNECCVYAVIEVQTDATSGGSATASFSLVSDSEPTLATSRTVHFKTGAIPVATLKAGYRVAVVELPRGTYERYLGVWVDVAGAAFTAGKVNAYLTVTPPSWHAQKSVSGAQ